LTDIIPFLIRLKRNSKSCSLCERMGISRNFSYLNMFFFVFIITVVLFHAFHADIENISPQLLAFLSKMVLLFDGDGGGDIHVDE
jgi:hypothetical protein